MFFEAFSEFSSAALAATLISFRSILRAEPFFQL